MFAHLLLKYPRSTGRLAGLLSMKEVFFYEDHSLILHIHRDEAFFSYAKTKPDNASQLFRGSYGPPMDPLWTPYRPPMDPLGLKCKLRG